MTDYATALQAALYDRLNVLVTKAPVFQHPPENVAPPVVLIADLIAENVGSKGANLLRFDITIVSIIAGPGRKPLFELQAEVMAALDQWKPDDTLGATFGELTFASSSGREITGTDGEPIYYGEQQFSVFVQDA